MFNGNGHYYEIPECVPDEEEEEEPSVTPTPTDTPQRSVSNPDPNPTGGSVCTVPIDDPELQGFERVTPTSVKFDWWTSTDPIDKQAIVYGYAEDSLVYAVRDLGKDIGTYTINDVEAGRHVWAQVWNFQGDCVSKSQIVDP